MLAYLCTFDYSDKDYSGSAAGVASPEGLAEDEERPGSTSKSLMKEQDNASATTDEPSLLN